MKTKLLALILSAVVLLGGAVGAVAYANTPEVVTAKALLGIVKDFTEREEINPLYNMLTQGSLEVSASKIEDEDGDNMMEDFSVSGKIYFSKEALMLQNIDVTLFEDFHASGDIYLSKDLIYIKENEILGDAYGVKPSEFASDLANSIFAADSGSEYAIPDEEIYDAITDSTESIDLDNMKKDAEKLLTKYVKDLWKIICEHADFDSDTRDVRLNGEKKSARVITIEIDADAMENIIRDAYNYLAEDKDMIEFIEKYESIVSPYLGDLYDSDEYDSLAEAYQFLIEEAETYVDEICDELPEYMEDITIEVVTPKLSSNLLKLSVKVGNDTFLTVDLGEKGMKKTDKISVEIEDVKIVYEIESDKKSKKTTATLKAEGEEIASATIDQKRNSFRFEVGEYTVSGGIESAKKATTITVDKIHHSWYSYYDNRQHEADYETDIELVISEKDKIPKAPKDYKKISDITESDIKRWLEKVGDSIF